MWLCLTATGTAGHTATAEGPGIKDLGLATLQGQGTSLTLWGMTTAVLLWDELSLAGHALAVHFRT